MRQRMSIITYPKGACEVYLKYHLLMTSIYEIYCQYEEKRSVGDVTYIEKPRRMCSRCRLIRVSMASVEDQRGQ